MTLIKWRPQSVSQRPRMMSEFDRMWSDFIGPKMELCGESCDWAPRVDIVENPGDYQLVIEVPGFENSDFKLKVEDEVLIVSGERKIEDEKEGSNYRRVERLYGNFERRFRLPAEAEIDKIDAEYKQGLLTISIAKSEKVAGREITVK